MTSCVNICFGTINSRFLKILHQDRTLECEFEASHVKLEQPIKTEYKIEDYRLENDRTEKVKILDNIEEKQVLKFFRTKKSSLHRVQALLQACL